MYSAGLSLRTIEVLSKITVIKHITWYIYSKLWMHRSRLCRVHVHVGTCRYSLLIHGISSCNHS